MLLERSRSYRFPQATLLPQAPARPQEDTMRYFITIPTVTAAAIVFSSAQAQVTRSDCTASAIDAKAVDQTVHAFYDAERVGDVSRWRALATPDFYMFHEGESCRPRILPNSSTVLASFS